MDVSIVIVSYNGRDDLRCCLTSVFERTLGVGFEVIVTDNASSDGTPEMVIAEFPQVTLIRRATNAGFAYAVNQGIAVARGRTFFLLNPDAELLSNALPPMLDYLDSQPDVAVLAPKLLDPDGSLQLSCRAFPGFSAALFNRYSLITRLFGRNRFSTRYLMTDFDHSETADVDWASAACWLLPRLAYEKIGPLDEGYFWTIEDVDYCQRAHRAGLRVVYFPEVAVQHHIGRSAATLPYRTIIERHRGMWRYYRTYVRPTSKIVRILVDSLVWTGVQSRCAVHLASSGLRRLATRGKP
ncbi:MAG: glycosyltransferase family 2 protein [Chloroflexi bacterium]|nr:glycosyltransferase family 2 protein [Chloroflexota bacterium]